MFMRNFVDTATQKYNVMTLIKEHSLEEDLQFASFVHIGTYDTAINFITA